MTSKSFLPLTLFHENLQNQTPALNLQTSSMRLPVALNLSE